MVTYKYKAISRDGLPVSGIVEAYDEYAAVAQIKETCSLVTRITPVRERSGLLTKEINVKKIDLKALSMVCSQFLRDSGGGDAHRQMRGTDCGPV